MEYLFKSYKIFKLFGIDVYIHGTLFLWLFLISMFSVKNGLFLSILFFYVLLHEFGHSLMAKHKKVLVKSISLYPFGGIADLSLPIDRYSASKEFLITIAGPLVNVFFSVLFLPFLYLHHNETIILPKFVEFILLSSFICNFILLVFNLLPCFPMDGGRILRSILYLFFKDLLKSTKVVVYIGRAVCIAMLTYGLYYLSFNIILVSIIVYLLGNAEYSYIKSNQDEHFV